MSSADSHTTQGVFRSALIDHACGHRHAHLVPIIEDGPRSLFVAIEIIASQPCPACVLAEHGLPPMLPERRASMQAM